MIPEEEYADLVKKLPIVCVDIFLLDDEDRLLTLIRSQEPEKGKQWVPGGRVRLGESLEDAAIRHIGTDVSNSLTVNDLKQIEAATTVFERSAFGEHPYQTINVVFCGRVRDDYISTKNSFVDHLNSDTSYYVRHYWDKAKEKLNER